MIIHTSLTGFLYSRTGKPVTIATHSAEFPKYILRQVEKEWVVLQHPEREQLYYVQVLHIIYATA